MKELTPYLSKPPPPRTFFAKANEKKKVERENQQSNGVVVTNHYYFLVETLVIPSVNNWNLIKMHGGGTTREISANVNGIVTWVGGIANAGSVTRFNSLIEYSISSRCDGSNEEFIFFPRRYDKSDALKNKEDDGWKWGKGEEGDEVEEKGLGQASIQAEVFTFDLWYSFKSTITFFASFFFFYSVNYSHFHLSSLSFFFYGRFFLENNHVGIDYIARYVFLFNVFFFFLLRVMILAIIVFT